MFDAGSEAAAKNDARTSARPLQQMTSTCTRRTAKGGPEISGGPQTHAHPHAYLHDRGGASVPGADLLQGVGAAHAEYHRPGRRGVTLQHRLQARLLRTLELHVVAMGGVEQRGVVDTAAILVIIVE